MQPDSLPSIKERTAQLDRIAHVDASNVTLGNADLHLEPINPLHRQERALSVPGAEVVAILPVQRRDDTIDARDDPGQAQRVSGLLQRGLSSLQAGPRRFQGRLGLRHLARLDFHIGVGIRQASLCCADLCFGRAKGNLGIAYGRLAGRARPEQGLDAAKLGLMQSCRRQSNVNLSLSLRDNRPGCRDLRLGSGDPCLRLADLAARLLHGGVRLLRFQG